MMIRFNAIEFSKTALTIIVCAVLLSACNKPSKPALRIAFYNTENLFDTIDNPLTQDDDLTPEGRLQWNKTKYEKKLKNISRVIDNLNSQQHRLAFIGLCEVENTKTIQDLLHQTNNAKYKYIISHSRDHRGSNVCLLYSPALFKPFFTTELTPTFADKHTTSRNILHITGCLATTPQDTLDLFVCHFPSRWGGEAKTERLRNSCATLLRLSCDSVSTLFPKHSILIMGDFNDYPTSHSIKDILNVKVLENGQTIEKNKLYNLFGYNTHRPQNWGSYKYKREWGCMDQIIVNSLFINKCKINTGQKVSGEIFSPTYLLRNDYKYGGKIPYRTYWGKKYIGGYSDHLPVYTDISLKQNKITR